MSCQCQDNTWKHQYRQTGNSFMGGTQNLQCSLSLEQLVEHTRAEDTHTGPLPKK